MQIRNNRSKSKTSNREKSKILHATIFYTYILLYIRKPTDLIGISGKPIFD